MSEERCDGCRFWRAHDRKDSDLGECHRFPPHMAKHASSYRATYDTIRPQDGGWPFTFPEEWCGEFKPPAPSSIE